MFAIAIFIFVLPALLKHLQYSLDPIELRDSTPPGAFVDKAYKPGKKKSEGDEGVNETQTVRTCVQHLGLSKEGESAMNGAQDEEMTGTVEAETLGKLHGPELPEPRVESETLEVESSGSEMETEGNGISNADPSMPDRSRAPSSETEAARRTSSKVASLRAAFEPVEKPGEEVKRRFVSIDGKSADAGREHEAEITRLKNELEKEKDLRIAYEEKVSSLEDEIEELNAQLEEHGDAWREEYESRRQQERDEAEDRLNAMAGEVRSQKLEAITLQKQLSELKRSVSMSTRTSTQITDTTFRQEIGLLQHEIQNWVVNNFRRVKIEFSPGDICSRLEGAVPTNRLELLQDIYKEFEPAVKLPIFQATVACYLMDVFEDPFLFGLSTELAWAERSREAAESLQTVLSIAAYNRWRAVTFDALRQTDNMKEHIESAASDVARKINVTLDIVTSLEADDARLASLKTIVKRIIDIAHLVRVQQAQYTFDLPAPGDRFDATSMDDISEDSDADVEHTLICATFPSILKVGDENGDHIDMRNLMVKAKVLCKDAEP